MAQNKFLTLSGLSVFKDNIMSIIEENELVTSTALVDLNNLIKEHNHDDVYAELEHDHDEVYAPITHGTHVTDGNQTWSGNKMFNGSISLNGTDLNLKTSSTTSNDSGDIVFTYGNGNEKCRIYTENEPTNGNGPYYRVKKTDGTSLYDGRLATVADIPGAATQSAAGLMSAADKKKLDGIATGANAYTHPNTHPASIITGLATVATSGSYNDLSNKPTIPTSLPANGGNADTVDNKHASDFMPAGDTSHGTHVTDGAQTWSGIKTFASEVIFDGGGTKTDICPDVAAAFKTKRIMANQIIADSIILGASSGTASNKDLTIQKYGKITSTAPDSLTTLLTFDTKGRIRRTSGGSWISARDNTIIMQEQTNNSGSSYNPIIGAKTQAGFWSMGSCGGETLYLSYDTDENYNTGNNTSSTILFPTAGRTGTIALTADIPTSLPADGGSSEYASKLGDANGYYTKASLDTALSGKSDTGHTHDYIPNNPNSIEMAGVSDQKTPFIDFHHYDTVTNDYDYRILCKTGGSTYGQGQCDFEGITNFKGNVLTHKDNTYDLGTSSKKWKTVYAHTFSGTASSSEYASKLGDANGYYTKTSLDNALNGKASSSHGHSELTIESISDPNLAYSDQKLKYYLIGSTNSGTEGYAGKNYGFPVSHNANSILWLGNHSGNHGGQLGISGNGYLYYRWITSGTFPTTADGASWNRIAYTTDIPSSLPASDVYLWAKAANKPSYNFGEINAGNATIGDGVNSLFFRTTASWASSIYHETTSDEAVVFLNAGKNVSGNAGYTTSWIFAYGNPSGRPAWTSLTPAMQIKDNSVVINKLLGSQVKASYNLDVNGSANATELYENGTRVSLVGHTHDINSDNLEGTLEAILESLNAAIQTNSGLIAVNAAEIAKKANIQHGNHVPEIEATTNNTRFLRNDNTWQTITPGNIGAAVALHGNHVPEIEATTNNTRFLRNDNTWQTVTPDNIGAATASHDHPIFSEKKAANMFFAGPLVGNSAVPGFRKITVQDLPTGTSATTVSLGNHTHTGYAATNHGTHVTDDDQEWAGVKTFVNGIRIGDDSDPDEEFEANRTIYFGDSSYAYISEFPSDQLTLSAGRINICGEDTLTTKAIFPETTNYKPISLPSTYSTSSTRYSSAISFSRQCTQSTFVTVGEASYPIYINGSNEYIGISVAPGYTVVFNVGAGYTAYRDTLWRDYSLECTNCRYPIEYTVQPFLDSTTSLSTHRIRYYLAESASSTTPISGTVTDIPVNVDGYTSYNPLTVSGSNTYAPSGVNIKYTNTGSSYKTVYLKGCVFRASANSVTISSAGSGYWRYTTLEGSDITRSSFTPYPSCRNCGTTFNATTLNRMWTDIGSGKVFYTYFKNITTYYRYTTYKTNTTFSLPSLPMSTYGPVAILGNGIISGTSTTFDNTNLVSGDKGLINTTTQLCYKFADAMSGFLVDSNTLSYISGAYSDVSLCPSRIFDITANNGLTFSQGGSGVSPQYMFNVKNGKIILGYYTSSNTSYSVDIEYDGITPNSSGTFTLGTSTKRLGTIYSTSTINTSDERFKERQSDIDIDFDKLKTIPKFIFKWKDSFLKDDDDLHIGTSAQAIRDIYPEIVHVYNNDVELCAPRDIYDPDAVLAIEYDKLGVIALAAVDKLHEENIQLKEENEQLKTRLDTLETILKEKGIL